MSHRFNQALGFDWDEGNRDKNFLKHSVSNGECEQIFFNEPLIILDDLKHSTMEVRYSAFGRTDEDRRLVIVFTTRGRLIRVISARDMDRRERKFNEKSA